MILCRGENPLRKKKQEKCENVNVQPFSVKIANSKKTSVRKKVRGIPQPWPKKKGEENGSSEIVKSQVQKRKTPRGVAGGATNRSRELDPLNQGTKIS